MLIKSNYWHIIEKLCHAFFAFFFFLFRVFFKNEENARKQIHHLSLKPKDVNRTPHLYKKVVQQVNWTAMTTQREGQATIQEGNMIWTSHRTTSLATLGHHSLACKKGGKIIITRRYTGSKWWMIFTLNSPLSLYPRMTFKTVFHMRRRRISQEITTP